MQPHGQPQPSGPRSDPGLLRCRMQWCWYFYHFPITTVRYGCQSPWVYLSSSFVLFESTQKSISLTLHKWSNHPRPWWSYCIAGPRSSLSQYVIAVGAWRMRNHCGPCALRSFLEYLNTKHALSRDIRPVSTKILLLSHYTTMDWAWFIWVAEFNCTGRRLQKRFSIRRYSAAHTKDNFESREERQPSFASASSTTSGIQRRV